MPVIFDPLAEIGTRRQCLPAQQHPAIRCYSVFVPFKKTPADNLRSLGLRGHHHCLTHPIEQLLEALVIRLILGAHLELRRGNGHRQHHVVPPARFLAEVVKEAVELAGHAALSAAVDEIHQLIHQDEHGAVSG
jgi:hypothetical protein